MKRIERDQVIGPDGKVIRERLVERDVPPNETELLAAIQKARTVTELRDAVVAYLTVKFPSREA